MDIPSTPGNPTINFTSAAGNVSINSLTSADPLNISADTLTVAGTLTMTGQNLTLSGGTVQGATMDMNAGAEIVGTSGGGTLDGVTLNGNLDLSLNNGALVTGTNNLVLNGTVLLGNAAGTTYGQLDLGASGLYTGSLTTTSTATILMGGSTSNELVNEYAGNQSGGTLTIGPNITIKGQNGSVENRWIFGTIVNQGVIDADTAGDTINITDSIYAPISGSLINPTFANAGTMEATSGGTLDLDTNWSNTGTLSENGGTLTLGGQFTTAGLGALSSTGGTINLTGALENTGNTLNLNATTGSWNLLGGTVLGGTISESGGAELVATATGGTLDGVTFDGTLDLSQSINANLTAIDNLVLNGTVLIGNSAGTTYGELYLGNASSQGGSLTGTGKVEFGAYLGAGSSIYDTIYNTLYNAYGDDNVATLSIGSGLTIAGDNGRIVNEYDGDVIVNQGTIDANQDGGNIIELALGALNNTGTLEGSNGGALEINSHYSNTGTITGAVTIYGEPLPTPSTSTVTWTGALGNDLWSASENWSGDELPTDGQNVVIPYVAGASPIIFDSTAGTVEINSLTTGIPINLNGGVLIVSGAVTLVGVNLTMGGGTLRGATVDTSGGAEVMGTALGGTLDGVTINGTLDLRQPYVDPTLTAINNLVINGEVLLGDLGGEWTSTLNFGSSASDGGSLTTTSTATVIFGGNSADSLTSLYDGNGFGGTFTIGPNVTIEGQNGSITAPYNSAIINQGVIDANTAYDGNGTLEMNCGSFTNEGTVEATNNATLILYADWSNTGIIRENGSTLYLEGFVTTAGLGTITSTGGTVNFAATLDNTGATLALNSSTGSWDLYGGTIRNGTISESNGAELVGTSVGGTLDGVTFDGTLDLSQGFEASVTAMNNLVVNGEILMLSASGTTSGRFYMGEAAMDGGSLTTDSTAIILGGFIANAYDGNGSGGTLTIGPNVTYEGDDGIYNVNNNSTIINQGVTILNGTISPIPASSVPIALNTPTLGTIETVGTVAQFTFEGNVGEEVTVAVNPASSSVMYLDQPIDRVNVELLDANSYLLASAASASSGAEATINDYTLPADGTYSVNVAAATGYSEYSGDFEITVSSVTPSGGGTGGSTVNQATPVITWANPAATTYGTPLSGAQLDATGTINGVAISGTFQYSLALGTILPAGANQTLGVVFTPTDTTDYTSADASAQITVNQATPVITWANPAAITYGTPLSPAQLDATATFNGVAISGTFQYTPALGTILPAGANQTLGVVFTPTDTTDYTSADGSAQITVNQATPVITWTTPADVTPGTVLSATQLDATASFEGSSIPGAFVYTPAIGTALTAGAHTLSVTFTPTDTTDFTSTNDSVTISAGPSITSLSAGDPPVGTALTLTAAGVTSYHADTIKTVMFYLDTEGGTTLNAKDKLLGAGTLVKGTNDYALSISTASMAVSTYGFFAVATDPKGIASAAAYAATSITPSAPAKLVFSTEPAKTAKAGTVLTAVVRIQDIHGNLETSDDSALTISIASGPMHGAFTGSSTTTINAIGGVATFNNLVLDTAGTYTLQVADATDKVKAVKSASIKITPGSVARVTFVKAPPARLTAGKSISPAITIEVTDAYGNPLSGQKVTLMINTGPTGSVITGSTSAKTSGAGIATFTGMSFRMAGAYTLVAAVGSLKSAITGNVVVAAAPASKLVFTTSPPAGIAAGSMFNLALDFVDAYGNLATSANGSTLKLSLATSPRRGALGGMLTAMVNDGVATFSNLTLSGKGAYKLKVLDALDGLRLTSAEIEVT